MFLPPPPARGLFVAMRIFALLLPLVAIGCHSLESDFREPAYAMSPRERQCENLRQKIAQGTNKEGWEILDDIFAVFAPGPSDAYGIPISTIRAQEEQQKFNERLIQYKIALENYKTLCK